MLIRIPGVLTPEQVRACRSELERADWQDGKATAGSLTQSVKNNTQIPANHPVGRRLGGMVLEMLQKNKMFIRAALPLRIVPPCFNRYGVGQSYGDHVDATVQHTWGTSERVRTDLSATLFITPPEDYDGGVLTILDEFGERPVKLPAGDLVVYPATSVHHVTPVTHGVRLAAFFWIQSMVREDSRRSLLFELGTVVQQFEEAVPEHPAITRLTGVYFNLFRMWTDT